MPYCEFILFKPVTHQQPQYLTRVWFNGLSIGGHEGSFTQFRLRVNGVRFGDWNRVVVKVDNNSKSRPLGRGCSAVWVSLR
ncbi:MAG: hypothetical protein RXQ00_07845 [Caldivirga sp.]